jgi:concanavalin A-like lectin/glucanase superfamily protein
VTKAVRVFLVLCLSVLSVTASLAPARGATTAFQTAVANEGPILWYQFNEPTGNAINHGSLGATHDAAYNGTIQRGASTYGGDDAVAFDGSDDYLESLADAPAGMLGNPTFTAEAIVFVPSPGSVTFWAPFLHWGPDSDGTMKSVYFSFSNGSPTEVFAGFYNGGLQTPTGALALDRWHHVVWVRTGGGAANAGSKVYIDGVDLTGSLVNDPDLPNDTSTPAVEAGEFRVNRARDFTRSFVGSIDELALYDQALTPQQVASHFVASGLGLSLDVDGNGLKQPLTDGLLLLRYLFGFRGATLITGAVGAGCTRCTAVAIEAYLASL